MKTRVYVETPIISYLTARPNRDLIIAGQQQVTHEWWQTSRHDFALVSSQLVAREAGAGDPEAAKERLVPLGELSLLEITEEALALAQHILQIRAIPVAYPEDALQVTVAVVNGIEYLLTWNYSWTLDNRAARACL